MAPVAHYVWQHPDWTRRWRWESDRLLEPLARTRKAQGDLLGRASGLGLDLRMEARAETLVDEAVGTAAIEGVSLDPRSVRSSVTRRLGLSSAGMPAPDRHADGLVEVLIDATQKYAEPLTPRRLKDWQAALFPGGRSGLRKIVVGEWRRTKEPMRVVSGPVGRERVHYEAPPAGHVAREMTRFLAWWREGSDPEEGLLRAGLAHLWFVTVHPFEDGNGRIARAITDMALAEDEKTGLRLYSMSARIRAERRTYYDVLERTQAGDGGITDWLEWFLLCLTRAVQASETRLDRVLAKSRLWQRQAGIVINERQLKVINRLLDAGPEGFEGGLTTRKYSGMTGTSRATAQREIADLVEKGFLRQLEGGGRSTSYDVAL
ncbi:MAG: Fic family protein [Acidobacteria bacterium]|nr:Fic family protein [Acidobacteriota bacterium]